jgi:hypothetical protein
VNGHLPVVQYLVENGANLSEWSLDIPVIRKHSKVVAYFLENGIRPTEYQIEMAVKYEHFSIMKLFLDYGIDMTKAVEYTENPAIVKLLTGESK